MLKMVRMIESLPEPDAVLQDRCEKLIRQCKWDGSGGRSLHHMLFRNGELVAIDAGIQARAKELNKSPEIYSLKAILESYCLAAKEYLANPTNLVWNESLGLSHWQSTRWQGCKNRRCGDVQN